MKKWFVLLACYLSLGCSTEMPTDSLVPPQSLLQQTQPAAVLPGQRQTQIQPSVHPPQSESGPVLTPSIPRAEPTLPPKLANIRVIPGTSSSSTSAPQTPLVESPQPVSAPEVHIAENYNIHTLMVGLHSAGDFAAAQTLVTQYNLTIERFIEGINTLVLKTQGQDIPDLISRLSQEPLFAFVETDHIATQGPEKETALTQSFRIFNSPLVNDTYFDQQYGLPLMQVPQAWEVSRGENTIVAVIDTGVDVDHEDLQGQLVNGYDAFSQQAGPEAADTSSLNYIDSSYKHGTHVAAVVAAQTNNGEGIAGVAPGAKIMPVKIFPDIPDLISSILAPEENAHQTIISVLADAIVWSADNGAQVINLSLGVFEKSEALERAVAYALAKNIVVVVAAGNERQTGNQINYLADIDGVIGVGATDANNLVTGFSNEGDYVSISAPGDEVLSAVPSLFSLRPYVKLSGTSMAAPHVAGVVALLRSKYGELATPTWVKQRLEKTALDRGDTGYDPRYGHGIVDAYRALTADLD